MSVMLIKLLTIDKKIKRRTKYTNWDFCLQISKHIMAFIKSVLDR